jgi:hypothetical protein
MTGHHRAVVALALLALLSTAARALAVDWGGGKTYDYQGSSTRSGDAYGRPQDQAAGSYRPGDAGGTSWQTQHGVGSMSAPPPATWGEGAASTWSGQTKGYATEPRSGQPDRRFGEYRFRQRPEDKAKQLDGSPRYRPDPELARRSQQLWGVPGQDPSQYGGGPAPVFRPLRPDQEQTSKSVASGQYYGDPPQSSWAGYPAAPFSGSGYPY